MHILETSIVSLKNKNKTIFSSNFSQVGWLHLMFGQFCKDKTKSGSKGSLPVFMMIFSLNQKLRSGVLDHLVVTSNLRQGTLSMDEKMNFVDIPRELKSCHQSTSDPI